MYAAVTSRRNVETDFFSAEIVIERSALGREDACTFTSKSSPDSSTYTILPAFKPCLSTHCLGRETVWEDWPALTSFLGSINTSLPQTKVRTCRTTTVVSTLSLYKTLRNIRVIEVINFPMTTTITAEREACDAVLPHRKGDTPMYGTHDRKTGLLDGGYFIEEVLPAHLALAYEKGTT